MIWHTFRCRPALQIGCALWMAVCAVGCSSTQELRAVIQDEKGRPIEGALFYAEAYTESGAFDFTFSLSGSSGEVPPAGRSLTLRQKWGAKLALSAFADGKKPVAVYDELGRVEVDGLTFVLPDVKPSEPAWEPRIGHLAFPFEKNSELAARVATPEYAPLREAFWRAYEGLRTGREPILPREQAKLQALEALKARTGP